MTDDLVKRLNYWQYGELSPECYKKALADMKEAAGRIEELEAELSLRTNLHEECIYLLKSTEAKLEKAVERLAKLEKSASHVSKCGATTGPQWINMSIDILAARTTLARLTGGKDE